MKLLYHHRIASRDGQYVHIKAIVDQLRGLGHHVILVGPDIGGSLQEEQSSPKGAPAGRLAEIRGLLPGFTAEIAEFAYTLVGFIKLSWAVIRYRPDGIYERYNLFYPAGIWVKKLFRIPLILEVNSPLHLERSQYGGVKLDRLAIWTEQTVWRNADHVLPVSHVLAGYLTKAGVEEEKISVIPNGINPDIFYANTASSKHDDFKNRLVVGFVGYCRDWHKLDEVLELVARPEYSHLYLLVVGDGPAAQSLRMKSRELGLENRFRLTGVVPRNEMPMWLDQIDIALQPAVTPWASPLKILEYLAKGLAIVAADTDNIRELLTDGQNALLFSPDDPDSLLACIERLSRDEFLRERLQRNAALTITRDKRLWATNAERIEALFRSLIQ